MGLLSSILIPLGVATIVAGLALGYRLTKAALTRKEPWQS